MKKLFCADALLQMEACNVICCLMLGDDSMQDEGKCLLICGACFGIRLELMWCKSSLSQALPVPVPVPVVAELCTSFIKAVASTTALVHSPWLGAALEKDFAHRAAIFSKQIAGWLFVGPKCNNLRERLLRGGLSANGQERLPSGKQKIISPGIADAGGTHEAIDTVQEGGGKPLASFHSGSSGYLASTEKDDRHTMHVLIPSFGLITRLSSGKPDNTTSIADVALVASVVEKHLTLDPCSGALGNGSSFARTAECKTPVVVDRIGTQRGGWYGGVSRLASLLRRQACDTQTPRPGRVSLFRYAWSR